MSKPPKVSVILPFFNAKNTLQNAIQSIVDQSFKDWELILINNNTIDGSGQIAEEFSKHDKRIKYHTELRQGVVFAANLGFANAKGSYLARMDADDLSYPDRLEKQVELLDQKPEVGLVSGLVNYQGNASNGGFIRYVNWLNSVLTARDIQLNQFAEYPIANPTVMIRRELVEKYGGFKEGDFPEDYEFFLRLQSHGILMEKVDQVVLDWNDSETRLTRTDTRYSHESFFKLKAIYLANWLKINAPQYPNVWIWGGGKLAKKRSTYLKEYGINIVSYIDIAEKGKQSTYYKDTATYKDAFVLSYVTSWDARQEVKDYLNANGFKEGLNYIICG